MSIRCCEIISKNIKKGDYIMSTRVLTVGELQEYVEAAENDEETGMSSISFVGIEIIDKNTKELKEYYEATGAWLNPEKDHLTITVEV